MTDPDLHLDELDHAYAAGKWTCRLGREHEDGFRAGWINAMPHAANRIKAAEVSCKILRKQRDKAKGKR
jgi:hypothetical protein